MGNSFTGLGRVAADCSPAGEGCDKETVASTRDDDHPSTLDLLWWGAILVCAMKAWQPDCMSFIHIRVSVTATTFLTIFYQYTVVNCTYMYSCITAAWVRA